MLLRNGDLYCVPDSASVAASLLTLTVLSVDGCFAICKPMKHKTMVTLTKIKIIIAKTCGIESLFLPIVEFFYRDSATAKYIQTLGVIGCYSIILKRSSYDQKCARQFFSDSRHAQRPRKISHDRRIKPKEQTGRENDGTGCHPLHSVLDSHRVCH